MDPLWAAWARPACCGVTPPNWLAQARRPMCMAWAMEPDGSISSKRTLAAKAPTSSTSTTSANTWRQPPSPSLRAKKRFGAAASRDGSWTIAPPPSCAAWTQHIEPAGAQERPVADAAQYLRQRLEHLDYERARRRLPIASGETESGHRHVIQQRLKLAEAWWTERNLESVLQLRVARANHWWDAYWKSATN